jgi:hypothetical protein
MQNVNKRRHGRSGRRGKYCRKLLFMFLLNLDFKAGHRGAYRQTATLQTSHRRSHLDSNTRKRGGRSSTDTSSLLRGFREMQIPIETTEQHDPIEQSASRVRRRRSNSSFQRSRRSMCPSPDRPGLDLERIQHNLTRASAALNNRMSISYAEGGGTTDKKLRYYFDWDDMLMEVSDLNKPFGGKGMHIDLRMLVE